MKINTLRVTRDDVERLAKVYSDRSQRIPQVVESLLGMLNYQNADVLIYQLYNIEVSE